MHMDELVPESFVVRTIPRRCDDMAHPGKLLEQIIFKCLPECMEILILYRVVSFVRRK